MLGASGVGMGAFGAHGLKDYTSPEQIDAWKTATQYQMIHTLAMLAVLLFAQAKQLTIPWAFRLWGYGILCFCGSIFLLSTRDIHHLSVGFLGPVTPVGGLLFILGWLSLFRMANVQTKT